MRLLNYRCIAFLLITFPIIFLYMYLNISFKIRQIDGATIILIDMYNNKKKHIEYTLNNNSDETIYFGDYVELEKKVNGLWYKLSENVGFTEYF